MELSGPDSNPIEYFLDCLTREVPVEGPLSPTISRIGPADRGYGRRQREAKTDASAHPIMIHPSTQKAASMTESGSQDEYGVSDVPAVESDVRHLNLTICRNLTKHYRPGIGLVGAGGISEYHLKAYCNLGTQCRHHLRCRALSARNSVAMNSFHRRPIETDYRRLLDNAAIEVIDVTTHPQQRVSIIEACLQAGRHVLSQKPFVLDLEVGQSPGTTRG